uniref:tRNA pseudouridine(55) synthase n=1 Tax=Phallusia mammillata TaxID=59560 RepID=A0A6F9DPF3_9ASCI|nr:putative tRNA pseudouridine synthase Pus10 [Phallusia mammillata]
MNNTDAVKRWEETSNKFCVRCVLRHLCFDWIWVLRNESEITEHLKETFPEFLQHAVAGADSIDNANHQLKRQGSCHCCLGILESNFLQPCLKHIVDALSKESYQFATYQPQYFLPVQLQVFGLYSMKYFEEKYSDVLKKHNPTDVKEVFKALMEPILIEGINQERDPNGVLEISLHLKHVSTETNFLTHVSSKCNEKKTFNRKRPKNDEPTFTLARIRSAMLNLNDSELEKLCSIDLEPSVVGNVQLFHTAVFVGGRYNKYSRELPQTPWLVEGERKLVSSVQEYISTPIQKAFGADSYNFSTSGREDVDVRMLGNGRPFLIELINARQSKMDATQLTEISHQINGQNNDVSVHSLKVVSKSDCKKLKEGEEEKTKSYSAVCCFIYPPSPDSISKLEDLSKITNLELKQKTPIRVLHRRPLATRSRYVHAIKAERNSNDSRVFKLLLSTQAGTYVKEFVHGDFGRTTPSLGDLLSAEVDIIDLDVESVNLQWPPT